jgi:hypothetical protein
MQPGVHTELDHPPQSVAVLLEQLAQRAAIPGPEALEQLGGFTGEVVADSPGDVLLMAWLRRRTSVGANQVWVGS